MTARIVLSLALSLVLSPSPLTAQTGHPDFQFFDRPEGFEEPLSGALAGIRADELAAHIELLSSPAMEGRGLGTRGLDAALGYAAASLKLAGIRPWGERDRYDQTVPLREVTAEGGHVEVERSEGAGTMVRRFACGVDCLVSPQLPRTVKAPVVFAGYGIQERQLGRDDYAKIDVRGRIVLILAGVPEGAAWNTPELEARYAAKKARERWAAKLNTAGELGAVAVLAVEGDELLAAMADEREEHAFYPWEEETACPLLMRVSRSVAQAIAGEAMLRGEPRAGSTPSVATVRIEASERVITSRNVIGIIPGSDPALRDEAVVIGAHVDHLGMDGDVVFHGADDNASGTAALLEIAEAFAEAAPPKRTVIFTFWTAEEEGHHGAARWVRNPRWPLARTVAYLNLDMIGHPWLASEIRELVVKEELPGAEAILEAIKPEEFVEPGVPRGVPALEAAVRRSAHGLGLPMHIDWTDGKEGGSDYREFARAGVPFIRFFGNFFPEYHETGDVFVRLDPTQTERVARFALAAAWELANPQP